MLLAQLAKDANITDLRPYLTSPDWWGQQKVDGHRVLLMSQDGANIPPTALTRGGTIYTRRLPRDIRDFRFPPGRWVIDGELMQDGTYWAFDMPRSPVTDERHTLPERWAVLKSFLDSIAHPFRLLPMATTTEEKIQLAKTALEKELEGLVLKKANSPYRSGHRSPDWLKVKFVTTADVVVKRLRADGKESVEYIVFDDAGQEVEIGKASLIGKEKRERIEIGDVLEIRYLYVGADGRLYQPTISHKRHDKAPRECTTDQLKHVNKEVLASL